MSFEKEYCDCGREKKHFFHNCPNSILYEDKYGCPFCDDICSMCIDMEE